MPANFITAAQPLPKLYDRYELLRIDGGRWQIWDAQENKWLLKSVDFILLKGVTARLNRLERLRAAKANSQRDLASGRREAA